MEDKLINLNRFLSTFKSAVIAFSGVVDSTFLARIATNVYGKNLLLVTATSSTYPFYELEEAKLLASMLGIMHQVIVSEEPEAYKLDYRNQNHGYAIQYDIL